MSEAAIHPLDVPKPKPRGRGKARRVVSHEEVLTWVGNNYRRVENLEAIHNFPSKLAAWKETLLVLHAEAPSELAFNLVCEAAETLKGRERVVTKILDFKKVEKPDSSENRAQIDDQRKMFRLWETLERERPDLAEAGRKSHAARQNRNPSINRVGSRIVSAPPPGDDAGEAVQPAVPEGLPPDNGEAPPPE